MQFILYELEGVRPELALRMLQQFCENGPLVKVTYFVLDLKKQLADEGSQFKKSSTNKHTLKILISTIKGRRESQIKAAANELQVAYELCLPESEKKEY